MAGRRAGRRMVRLRRRSWLVAAVAAALVGVLYTRPVQAYLHAQETLTERAQEVRELRREHAQLARRLRLEESGATLVREARKLGLVRPDERLFIVEGVDAWRKRWSSERSGGG